MIPNKLKPFCIHLMKKLQKFAKWFGFYVSYKKFYFGKNTKKSQIYLATRFKKTIVETEPLDQFS